jgi:hypothetical protein
MLFLLIQKEKRKKQRKAMVNQNQEKIEQITVAV